jgi:glucose dehydrogenase
MNCKRLTIVDLAASAALLIAGCDSAMPQAHGEQSARAEVRSAVSVVNRDTDDTRTATAIEAADWPMYNHDVAGWRFNPAEKALSPANVGKLVEKWRFPAANSKETIGVVHATPSVVAGEVYFGS